MLRVLGVPLIEIMFDSVIFAYVLKISGFQRYIKTPPSYFPFLFKAFEIEDCFGPTKILKFDLPKIQRFHAIPHIFKTFSKIVSIKAVLLMF